MSWMRKHLLAVLFYLFTSCQSAEKTKSTPNQYAPPPTTAQNQPNDDAFMFDEDSLTRWKIKKSAFHSQPKWGNLHVLVDMNKKEFLKVRNIECEKGTWDSLSDRFYRKLDFSKMELGEEILDKTLLINTEEYFIWSEHNNRVRLERYSRIPNDNANFILRGYKIPPYYVFSMEYLHKREKRAGGTYLYRNVPLHFLYDTKTRQWYCYRLGLSGDKNHPHWGGYIMYLYDNLLPYKSLSISDGFLTKKQIFEYDEQNRISWVYAFHSWENETALPVICSWSVLDAISNDFNFNENQILPPNKLNVPLWVKEGIKLPCKK